MAGATRTGSQSYGCKPRRKGPEEGQVTREKSALRNYREAIQTIETLRRGVCEQTKRAPRFLATTKDVFDETAAALAEMAILSSTAPDAPLAGKALEYAAEAFKVTEQSRARSLLDLLSETGASITEGIPAELAQAEAGESGSSTGDR